MASLSNRPLCQLQQRDEPVGVDSSGRTYWALEDLPSVLEGTVWVCRCATPKQDDDDDDMDGSLSQWETVTDDLETLESLIEWLSLSSETADLQLWQHFSSGILKSLVRRDKKAQQSTARLARMPRLLGGVSSSSGLDLGSIVNDDGFGVRRSTRSRRAVSYRIAESEDEEEAQEQEEEEEANDSDEEEEEEENEDGDANDEEDEERPSKRPRRSATTQQQRKPKRAEPEPSRRSSRLRGGGDADKSPSRAVRDWLCAFFSSAVATFFGPNFLMLVCFFVRLVYVVVKPTDERMAMGFCRVDPSTRPSLSIARSLQNATLVPRRSRVIAVATSSSQRSSRCSRRAVVRP